jgi:hypothetical protein
MFPKKHKVTGQMSQVERFGMLTRTLTVPLSGNNNKERREGKVPLLTPAPAPDNRVEVLPALNRLQATSHQRSLRALRIGTTEVLVEEAELKRHCTHARNPAST